MFEAEMKPHCLEQIIVVEFVEATRCCPASGRPVMTVPSRRAPASSTYQILRLRRRAMTTRGQPLRLRPNSEAKRPLGVSSDGAGAGAVPVSAASTSAAL